MDKKVSSVKTLYKKLINGYRKLNLQCNQSNGFCRNNVIFSSLKHCAIE